MLKHILTFLTLALAANAAMSHPGHDHSAWTSSTEHILFFMYLVTIALSGAYLAVKLKAGKAQKKIK